MNDEQNDSLTLGLLSFLFLNNSSASTLNTCSKFCLILFHYFKRKTVILFKHGLLELKLVQFSHDFLLIEDLCF